MQRIQRIQRILDIFPKISDETLRFIQENLPKNSCIISELLNKYHYQKNDKPIFYDGTEQLCTEISKGLMMINANAYIQNFNISVCCKNPIKIEIAGINCLSYHLPFSSDAYSNIEIQTSEEIKAVYITTQRNTIDYWEKDQKDQKDEKDEKNIRLLEKEPLIMRNIPYTRPSLIVEFYNQIPDNFFPNITLDTWTFSCKLCSESVDKKYYYSETYGYIVFNGSILTEAEIYDLFLCDGIKNIEKFVTNSYTVKVEVSGIYFFPRISESFISDIQCDAPYKISVNSCEPEEKDKILSSNEIIFYSEKSCTVSYRVNIVDHKYFKMFCRSESQVLPIINIS